MPLAQDKTDGFWHLHKRPVDNSGGIRIGTEQGQIPQNTIYLVFFAAAILVFSQKSARSGLEMSLGDQSFSFIRREIRYPGQPLKFIYPA